MQNVLNKKRKGFTLLSKKTKGFTLIELIVVIAVIGILVLLAMLKFLDYTRDAKMAQTKHDIKVAEGVIERYLIEYEDFPDGLDPADVNTALSEGRLWETRGLVEAIQGDPLGYVDVTGMDEIKSIKSRLDGRFVANEMGKVYYVHSKTLATETGEESGDGESGTTLCSTIPDDEWRPTNIPWDAVVQGSGAMRGGGPDMTLGEFFDVLGFPKEVAAGYSINGDEFIMGLGEPMPMPISLLTEYFVEMDLLDGATPEEVAGYIADGLTTQERVDTTMTIILTMDSLVFNPTYRANYNEDGTITDKGCYVTEALLFNIENIDGGVKIMSFTYNGRSHFGAELIIPEEIDGKRVFEIANGAFRSENLTSAIIPNSVRYIGDYAFDDNQLETIVIPNNVRYIGEYAFQENNLTSIDIGDSVELIGNSAFYRNGPGGDSNNLPDIGSWAGTWILDGQNWIKSQ